MLCQIINRTLLCNECVESVTFVARCWNAIALFIQSGNIRSMHYYIWYFLSHAYEYKTNFGYRNIFATKIFRTDLTLSTHYKYHKLVRFHHKSVSNSSQLSNCLAQESQENQWAILSLLSFHFSFDKNSLTYVCVRVCKTSVLSSNKHIRKSVCWEARATWFPQAANDWSPFCRTVRNAQIK